MNKLLSFYHWHTKPIHPASSILQISDNYLTLFNALATLIDLPDDGRLFLVTRPIVEILIKAWEKETGKRFDDWDQIDALYLYRTLGYASSSDSLYGTKTSHPIFSFLFTFSPVGAAELQPAFRSLGPFLLRRIRQCHAQVENSTDAYLYHLCLAARKIVAAAPDSLNEPKFDFDYSLRLALGKRAKEAVIGDTRLASQADWSYIRDLLFRNRSKLGAGSGGGEGEKKQRWLLLEHPPAYVYQGHVDVALAADPLTGFQPDDKPIDVCMSLSSRVPNKTNMLLAGEYDVDYYEERVDLLPVSWFADPWVARRNKRGKQEAQVMASRLQPWDHRCIAASTMVELLKTLMSDPPDTVLGVIAMSLLCGMSKRNLTRIKIASASSHRYSDPDESVTEHLVQGDRYFDANAKTLWWMNDRGSEHEARYMPVSVFVHLPLPEIIARHLPADRTEGASLFDRKDFTAARRFLCNMEEDGLGNVTLARLVSTFEGYFVGCAGFPELIADMMQGKERGHLKSQHYYITFDWNAAVLRWHEMVDSLSAYSGEGSHELLRKMVWRDANDAGSSMEYSGAVGTPDADSLREHIQQLLRSFPRNSEVLMASEFDAWNAYISYLYLLMAMSTGRRPQRDPFPNLNDFDLERGRIYIADKYNRKFREARVVPMCATLVAAMEQHLHIQPRMFMTMKLKGFLSETPPGMPFLIDGENRELTAVSPANIERLCTCSWQSLKNGPRHFLLTRLHQVGVPQETIDFLSGHRHEQREPEMSASPMSWERLADELAEIIEREVVQFLGLEVPIVG